MVSDIGILVEKFTSHLTSQCPPEVRKDILKVEEEFKKKE
jgi:hypothetical protein